MKDYRMRFIKDAEAALVQVLQPELVPMVSNIIIKALESYEITERCTDVAVMDHTNEKMMKRYSACLMIDGKSEGTIQMYHREIRRLSDAIQKPYTEMGTYDIRFYLATEKERGVSNRTLENTRAALSAFFQWMLLDDIIDKNPVASIRPIKSRSEIKEPFSDTETDALRSACDDAKKRAVIELLLSTGVRCSELTNLKLSDISTTDLTVRVRCGKGGKDRVTYMTPVCAKYVRQYLATRKDTEPWLLVNNRGNKMSASGIQHILKALGKKAGVSNVHPHRCRRTFATNLAKHGMEVQEIQRLLGHTDIGTTMIYVSVDDSTVRSAYNKYIA